MYANNLKAGSETRGLFKSQPSFTKQKPPQGKPAGGWPSRKYSPIALYYLYPLQPYTTAYAPEIVRRSAQDIFWLAGPGHQVPGLQSLNLLFLSQCQLICLAAPGIPPSNKVTPREYHIKLPAHNL